MFQFSNDILIRFITILWIQILSKNVLVLGKKGFASFLCFLENIIVMKIISDIIASFTNFAQRKKCPYLELFWTSFSRIRTKFGEIQTLSTQCWFYKRSFIANKFWVSSWVSDVPSNMTEQRSVKFTLNNTHFFNDCTMTY